MAEKVVAHALFEYIDPDGTRRVALRGDRINVDGDELARGERFGVFFDGAADAAVSSPLDGALVGDEEVLDGIVGEVDLVAAVADLDEVQRAALAAALAEAGGGSSPAGAQPTPLDVAAAADGGDELSSTGVVDGSESGERPPLTANKAVWLEFRGLGDLTEEQASDITKAQLQDDAFMSSYQRPAGDPA